MRWRLKRIAICRITLDVWRGRGQTDAMRHHSQSIQSYLLCCFVGILFVSAESCALDERGLLNTEGGANFESTAGGESSSSSSGVASTCGDLVVDMDEACDDGNMTPGDRCSPACKVEQPGVCPGTTITLMKGEMITITDSTTDADDNFIGSRDNIGNCGNDDYKGKDMIYAVTPAVDGTLTAELDADYDRSFVRARPACPASKSEELACDYRWYAGTTSISLKVEAQTTYYIAADSWDLRAGTFRLKLALN